MKQSQKGIPRRVHMIAVCGTGMGALALLFREVGAEVSGSDVQAYPPMGDLLRGAGVRLYMGYRPGNLSPDLDYVVVGNAVSRDNSEVAEMLRLGLAHGSFPETLSKFFLAGRQSIVIAGTHGKTTTTALLAWLLESAGMEPGFLVGGEPRNFGSSSRVGRGPFFVVEGDEYDSAFFDKVPKFLHYRPSHLVLTSLEYDHADIYPSLEALEEQFDRLVRLLPSEGSVLVCAEYPEAVAIARRARCTVETYGYREEADWVGRWASGTGPGGQGLEVLRGGNPVASFRVPIPGRHNGLNVLAAVGLLVRLGVGVEALQQGLEGFAGVRRRQEVVGEVDGVLLVDDFAHHPTAVRETLAALRERYPERRLLAVFEPRTHTSRRRVFQEEYAGAFTWADVAMCAPVFRGETLEPGERFDAAKWAGEIRRKGGEAHFFEDVGDLEEALAGACRPGDLVVFMSSGSMAGLIGGLRQRLEARRIASGRLPG